MASCDFDLRAAHKCPNSKAIGFDYCPDHLRSPRGLIHAREVVDRGVLFTEADVAAEIDRRARGPEIDYQTSALEKMDTILTECLDWLNGARSRLYELDPSDWRTTNRTGDEQPRTELVVYERAQERAARLLEKVSKMALQEKMVALGRSQMELVIELVQGTLEAVIEDKELLQRANKELFRRFQERANLSAKVEHEAESRLQLESGTNAT